MRSATFFTDVGRSARRTNHFGIPETVSSPSLKNIPVASSGKSELKLPPSCPIKGALAIVVNVGQGAMDARLRKTSAAAPGIASWRRRVLAYGEIVWVRRPGAGVKSRRRKPKRRWWQKCRSPGRNRISRKAIAQGKSGVLRWTCMLVGSISLLQQPARPRVQRAPGFPCAL